jgi:DNA-binding MarR family transcriptional regulator
VVANLEAAGLVLREPDPSDRRSTRVRVSPDGRRLLARIRQRKTAYLARQLGRLDDDERATVERAAAILERLLEEDGR